MSDDNAGVDTNEPLRTRGYQQEMLEASLRRNVVIAMDTGAGKTHIAVLRMKIEAEREPRKISWFLAPTVGLCEQQRSVILTSLPLPVGLISGALEPDQWKDPEIWIKALSTHRIIVSTPQVLLDALRHAYIRLGRDISLLVFDEAHHAGDNHPYNMIMREFYDRCAPRTGAIVAGDVKPFVLGLTASPIFGGKTDVERAFSKIEKNLDSIILAPSLHRPELLQHVHRPNFKHFLHEPPDYTNATSHNLDALKIALRGLDINEDPSVINMREKLPKLLAAEGPGSPNYARLDQRLSRALVKKDTFVNEGLRAFERTAKELCADIGAWAADWYVYSVVTKALGSRSAGSSMHAVFAERNHKEKAYLAGILRAIDVRKPEYSPEAISEGCSDKTNKLIECLRAEKAEWDALSEVYSGLIFATRRDAVLALSELLAHHPLTRETFVIGSLLGSSESTKRNAFLDITRTFITQSQTETLADFRAGLKNLVISTAVAEEGIDVQACGNVIRWDLPQNMVSWAQSRGRARHRRSSVILLFERGMGSHASLKKWEKLEAEMVQKYTDEQRHLRTIAAQRERNNAEDDDEDDDDEFRLASTGAVVTLHSAISHLAHFCNVLPSLSHEPEQPTYDIFPEDYPEGYHLNPENHILLPNPGPYGCVLTLPKLLPAHLRTYRTPQVFKSKDVAKRRAAFMAYVAMYHAKLLNENLLPLTSSFVKMQESDVRELLVDIEKREGVANVREQVNPWLPTASNSETLRWWSNELHVQALGKFRMLTQRKMPDLQFSETLHDPNYGPRMFSVTPGDLCTLSDDELLVTKHYTRLVFSIFYGPRMEWDDLEYSYLFLPLESKDDSGWEERRRWADSTRRPGAKYTARDRVLAKSSEFAAQFSYPRDVHMVIEGSSKGTVFYRFLGWRQEPLNSTEEERLMNRYQKRKHEFSEVQYPVIMALPQSNRTNFLLPVSGDIVQQQILYLLPQFTSVVLGNETDVTLSLLLPSILRAIVIKLIAHTLQRTLSQKVPDISNISLDLIKTALTTPSAIAHFNYERLEWLGDTVLKFITTFELIAEHPHWPEGFLSRAKDFIVSNVSLAKSAIGKQLYKFIIRKVFLARKWKPDYSRDPTVDANDSEHDEGFEQDDSDSDGKGDIVVQLSTKTLADVVESLIGAAYLSGGFERSIAIAKAFDFGENWQPIPACVTSVLSHVPHLTDWPAQLNYPEMMLGYVFRRKSLLIEALMHSSSQSDFPTMSYERMEFLGDAVLDIIVSEIIYEGQGKNYSPGQMSARRAAFVNSHFLAYICLKTRIEIRTEMPRWEAAKGMSIATDKQDTYLWQCILHSSHRILEEQGYTHRHYMRLKDQIEQAFHSGKLYPWAALTSLQAPKFLSDIVESLIGAIFLDSEGNLGAVRRVLDQLGVLNILRRMIRDDVDVRHPVSRISNWTAKYREKKVEFESKIENGMAMCKLIVDGEVVHTVADRHTGKTSQEEMKFRVAEEGINILERRFGVGPDSL